MARVRIYIDDSELRTAAVDLSGAPLRVQFNAAKTIRTGARIMDRQMRDDAKGHQGNWFGKPGTSYDTPLERSVSHEMVGRLEAEIGMGPPGVGSLAHIIVYGSVNNAPVYDHMAGPLRKMPEVEALMGQAAEDSVFGGEK